MSKKADGPPSGRMGFGPQQAKEAGLGYYKPPTAAEMLAVQNVKKDRDRWVKRYAELHRQGYSKEEIASIIQREAK